MEKRLFTSESVTEGHPDKVCDAISDAILDACMEQDPMSRVACETACCTGFVLITGEITTNAYVDMQKIVRDTVKEIGYTKSEYGFDGNTCAVLVAIDEQSADIAMGVDKALEAKAGENVKATSIKRYGKDYPSETSIMVRLSLRNLSFDGMMLNVPLFMIDQLDRLLESALAFTGPVPERCLTL